MAKFQMVGSENPNTIAVVTADVDIDSFRKDQNWYEISEQEEVVAAPRKRKSKGEQDGNKEEEN